MVSYFYSRPCGRGDDQAEGFCAKMAVFLLTPLREGRRPHENGRPHCRYSFLLTPLREGRRDARSLCDTPCGIFLLTPLREGRLRPQLRPFWMDTFLLTPLREGRLCHGFSRWAALSDFYSRPCGRGDSKRPSRGPNPRRFLLTPLREGRPVLLGKGGSMMFDFYSRPCGRGDLSAASA